MYQGRVRCTGTCRISKNKEKKNPHPANKDSILSMGVKSEYGIVVDIRYMFIDNV